jgi:hypothetical protein
VTSRGAYLCRFEESKIAEDWDIMSAIPIPRQYMAILAP